MIKVLVLEAGEETGRSIGNKKNRLNYFESIFFINLIENYFFTANLLIIFKTKSTMIPKIAAHKEIT